MSAPENQTTQSEYPDYIDTTQEKELLARELEHIQKQFPEVEASSLRGLAFSGGGIRSAIFSLGIMQALQQNKMLNKFHYLSTVSGGGYIGSALTWLLHDKWQTGKTEFDTGAHFPFEKQFGDCQDAAPARLLKHLRQNSNYLTPGGGITTASLLAVILRGSILSLLVYMVPIITAMVVMVECKVFGNLSVLSQHGFPGCNLFLILAGLSALLFAGIAVWYGLQTSKSSSPEEAYHHRRRYEKCAGYLLLTTVALALVGSLPFAAAWFDQARDAVAASLTAGGVVASVMAMMKSRRKEKGKIPLGLIAPVALALIVYGIFLSGFIIAYNFVYPVLSLGWLVLLAIGCVLAYVLGKYVNINYISIHRYYRDRLMELFMPDVDDVLDKNNKWTADQANTLSLHEMCNFTDGKVRGPYHLINTNMVTEGSSNKRLKGRGGESFLLSPLYCGSEATGWRATDRYMNRKINLATAMAISGAAADPHGAPGGEGLTRNKSLSFLMAFLNVRLGYWAPNPDNNGSVSRFPNWFRQGWHELIGADMTEKSPFVHLADGGHFENLAVYELIRRKVKTIVVCDGAADASFSFTDFANLIEKIRVDFGVEIRVQGHPNFEVNGKQAASLLAMSPKPNKHHPLGVALAKSGFVTATVDYGEEGVENGVLIYIKTTLISDLPDDIYAYKRGHSDFPDQTTADQFFDEKQFEAYRELGYRIGLTLLKSSVVRAAFGLADKSI